MSEQLSELKGKRVIRNVSRDEAMSIITDSFTMSRQELMLKYDRNYLTIKRVVETREREFYNMCLDRLRETKLLELEENATHDGLVRESWEYADIAEEEEGW